MEVFAVLASVQSMGLTGIQGYPVTVEAYCVDGMPMFEIVGLPDAAVKESRERVRAAMSACHTPFPVARLTLNLAPADVRKEGPAYDLPIALAILASMGRLDAETMAGMAAVGELSLSGGVMGVRGALSMAIAAKESGLRAIMLPASNAAEAACIEGLDVLPVAHLSEAIDHLRGRRRIEPLRARPYAELLGEKKILCDFADVRGQKGAKRALEIAAAGGHNVLMIGPPGSGKTMMARCLPGILPDMTLEEALEVTRIHSAAGTLAADAGLMAERPHHTVSAVALVGGGTKARPGEISLAHNGVLFLDELPEYDRGALEALRQPLEDGFVSVVRVSAQAKYPARAMFVAAMNPLGDDSLRDEPVPLRQLRQLDAALPLHPEGNRALSGAHLRAAAGQNRHAARGHGCPRAPDHRERAGRALRGDSRACAGRAQAAAGAIRGRGRQQKRGAFRAPARTVLPAGRRLPRADRQGLRQIQPLHARGQPGAQGRADNRRPRGGGEHRQGAYSGSAAVSQSGRKLLEIRGKRNA